MSNQAAFEVALVKFRKDSPAGSVENYARGWNNSVPLNKKVKIPIVENVKAVRVRKKLTETIVRSMRRDFAGGDTQRDLVQKYDLSPGTVSGVVNYKTWKDVR